MMPHLPQRRRRLMISVCAAAMMLSLTPTGLAAQSPTDRLSSAAPQRLGTPLGGAGRRTLGGPGRRELGGTGTVPFQGQPPNPPRTAPSASRTFQDLAEAFDLEAGPD